MEAKTVLITGATSGIGKAIAYRLAASKIQLIIEFLIMELVEESIEAITSIMCKV